jgi:nucleoside-diphosphate-sugar epimerase
MNVLLTGAFGNIGKHTLEALILEGHNVRCFDLPTRANRQAAKKYGAPVVWGDLRNYFNVKDATEDVDAVIHLAAIIPPASEKDPDFAYKVNVEGTDNLLIAAQRHGRTPQFVFSSSVSVYGFETEPLLRVGQELKPEEDVYAKQKVEAEKSIKASGLPYTIFRVGAALPLGLKTDPLMFEIPLSERVPFVHVRDVATAAVNTLGNEEAVNKTFNIAGGEVCQINYGYLVETLLDAMCIGMLPKKAFTKDRFHLDWMDTEESQRVLNFQNHTFHDYVKEMQDMLGWKKGFTKLFARVIRWKLLKNSPYYKK